MLWGHTVRSPHAHARILGIDTARALTMAGVHAVLTHADVPGEKRYGLEVRDQPVLAIDRVRYFGEPVAIIAWRTIESAIIVAPLTAAVIGMLESERSSILGDSTMLKLTLIATALTVLGALLVPPQSMATPRPSGIYRIPGTTPVLPGGHLMRIWK